MRVIIIFQVANDFWFPSLFNKAQETKNQEFFFQNIIMFTKIF